MDKLDEVVYAVKREDLEKTKPLFDGYLTPPDDKILKVIYKKSFPVIRRECENNPEIKHVIPYIVLTSESGHIFVMRRTENQTEERLHGKASIGVGGHIGPLDGFNFSSTPISVKDAIYLGAFRELNEEVSGVKYKGDSLYTMLELDGMVSDDSNDVGKVHLGLVFKIVIQDKGMNDIKVRETNNMTGKWMTIEDAKMVDNYENWSAFILKSI